MWILSGYIDMALLIVAGIFPYGGLPPPHAADLFGAGLTSPNCRIFAISCNYGRQETIMTKRVYFGLNSGPSKEAC